MVVVVVVVEAGQQCGHKQSREERAWEQGVPELLQHHRELAQCEPLSAVGLGKMEAEPVLCRHGRPYRRPSGAALRYLAVGAGLGHGARHVRWTVGRQPALGRLAQRLVFLGDGDGH